MYCGEKMCLISIKTPKLNSSATFFFLMSNFTFCFQSARLEPYKIEQEWNHMVLLPRPTLCTRTYTSRLLCMFFSSVNAFWTNLEIPALLSRETVTEFLSIKSLHPWPKFKIVLLKKWEGNSTKGHSFCKQCLHKNLVFTNWRSCRLYIGTYGFGC